MEKGDESGYHSHAEQIQEGKEPMTSRYIASEFDGLKLGIAITVPAEAPKGIVQFSHGMAEHKERYFDFMNYLSGHGYVCVIHDHRGHGESVKAEADRGYFYTENEQAIIEDLHTVNKFIRNMYPDIPVFLFSHSMGTLVARGFLKKYDSEIEKIVLCGPPTHNAAAGIGLALAKVSKAFHSENAPAKMLNAMAFSGFNAGNAAPNGWLSQNEANVAQYNADPLCGFLFTTNGFINLFKLQKNAFDKRGWTVNNPALPIFLIAGEDDLVIRSGRKFDDLGQFLTEVGYADIRSRLYEHMRHEILNETDRQTVYRDVLDFLND